MYRPVQAHYTVVLVLYRRCISTAFPTDPYGNLTVLVWYGVQERTGLPTVYSTSTDIPCNLQIVLVQYGQEPPGDTGFPVLLGTCTVQVRHSAVVYLYGTA